MLFEEQVARRPNHYPWTQDFIDAIWAGFWTANKFNFDSDIADFHSEFSDQEREIVTRCLSAISQIEVAVKTFWGKLGENLPHPAMFDLGFVMANTEVIHNHAYERLLVKLGLEDVFEENLDLPVIRNRVNYLRKYTKRVYTEDERKQYLYAIILFTLFVENVSLFSQFYIILWFNKFENRLKDAAQQVKYTRNEELLHAQVGIKLINTMRDEYPELFDDELERRIYEECKVAFLAEAALVDWMVGDYVRPKLSASLLKAYVADRLNESLRSIGYKNAFHVPEEDRAEIFWMTESLLAPNLVDFFHSHPTDYTKADQAFDDGDLF